MKIKIDFITNSSTTCHIVAIPENYNLYELVNEHIKLGSKGFHVNEAEFLKACEELIENGEISGEDEISNSLVEILYNKKLLIHSVYGGGGMGDYIPIFNVLSNKHYKRIKEVIDKYPNHFELAKKTIDSWPDWKKEIAGVKNK